MPTPAASSIHVVFPQEGESFRALGQRLYDTPGEVLLVLSGREEELMHSVDMRTQFLDDCKRVQSRLRIATKHPAIAADARGRGIRVLDRTSYIKSLLAGHPKQADVLRVFSPHLWRQQLTARLQHMGLLSLPRLRIFSLVLISFLLFLFVVFHLLPSAEIRVWARQEPITQTVNIILLQTGAVLDPTSRVRTMPLKPIVVKASQSMIFNHISQQFIGTSSSLTLQIHNTTDEPYTLRKGTRFSNQAGMIFTIQKAVSIDAGQSVNVKSIAADTDLYGQIIGDRGNVPAGLKWEIPGLLPEDRAKVFAENPKAGTGGTTAYRSVLVREDLELAQKRLEQELLTRVKQLIGEELTKRNATQEKERMELLNYPELTRASFSGVVLPLNLIGQQVDAVPVSGAVTYTMYTYDKEEVFERLRKELTQHVREGRRLLYDNLDPADLIVHVIDYSDDLSWIKLTVDLNGTEEYILDPLSPTGALFGKKVREQVTGMRSSDAVRIIRNMPEVERVTISQWPPWRPTLPAIPAHISIAPQ